MIRMDIDKMPPELLKVLATFVSDAGHVWSMDELRDALYVVNASAQASAADSLRRIADALEHFKEHGVRIERFPRGFHTS